MERALGCRVQGTSNALATHWSVMSSCVGPDATGSKDVVKLRAHLVQGRDDDLRDIGNNPRFAQEHANPAQTLCNVQEVFVLRATREYLISNYEHASGDDPFVGIRFFRHPRFLPNREADAIPPKSLMQRSLKGRACLRPGQRRPVPGIRHGPLISSSKRGHALKNGFAIEFLFDKAIPIFFRKPPRIARKSLLRELSFEGGMDASSVSGPDMRRERSRLDDLRNESIHAATDRTNHQLTGCPSAASRAKSNSTWFALRNPVFCRLWFATLLSGTFVSSQDVVATWLMHDLGASPFLLSLMATAASAPFFLFTLPAGAIADIVNRRTVIVSAVLWQAALVGDPRLRSLRGSSSPGPFWPVFSLWASGWPWAPRFGEPLFPTSSARRNCPRRSRWEGCNSTSRALWDLLWAGSCCPCLARRLSSPSMRWLLCLSLWW